MSLVRVFSSFFAMCLMVSLVIGGLGAHRFAHAELTANVPLDVSRFEMMSMARLTAHAQAGNDDAQFYLAKRYQKGIGTAIDTKQALTWYTQAAERNVTPAQLNLGLMYAKGEGTQVDEKQARYWLERAARRGDNRASYTLALIEEKQSRLVDAFKWYDLAAREGMLDKHVQQQAAGKIGQLAINLSPEDQRFARSQADSWFQTQ